MKWNYAVKFKLNKVNELNIEHYQFVMISKNSKNLHCLDLSSKSIISENKGAIYLINT